MGYPDLSIRLLKILFCVNCGIKDIISIDFHFGQNPIRQITNETQESEMEPGQCPGTHKKLLWMNPSVNYTC